MKTKKSFIVLVVIFIGTLSGFYACNNNSLETEATVTSTKPTKPANSQPTNRSQTLATQPHSIAVVVNKTNKLPDAYRPTDLVLVNIPFIKSATKEKRQMRKEAAVHLEQLVAAAKQDNILLIGVSGYRSRETQAAIYNNYVKRDGEAKANTYSAKPGTSEHETGLSIDMTGHDGTCAASDCFGSKPEAKWIANNAYKFGYIVRYPKGKEAITGYKYEPWHIRYVGVPIATEIHQKGITLEEYFGLN
jgi:D-alanyl-D-alanine carboxypeptidase